MGALQQALLMASSSVVSGTTEFLCHFDNLGGAFIDSSPNGIAMTPSGGASQVSTQAKFGAGSMESPLFWVATANEADLFIPWDTPCTIEGWIYITNVALSGGIFLIRNETTQTIFMLNRGPNAFSGTINTGGGSPFFGADTYAPINTWAHVAICCVSPTANYFLCNGVRQGSFGSVTALTRPGSLGRLFLASDLANPLKGFLDEFRIVRGAALYPNATYTVPTAPFT